MAKTRKIAKKQQDLNNKVQLELLQEYFGEYNLMNHYENWLNSRLAKTRPPAHLDWKIFFNPITKLYRKYVKKNN
jgi:hypothetical protein